MSSGGPQSMRSISLLLAEALDPADIGLIAHSLSAISNFKGINTATAEFEIGSINNLSTFFTGDASTTISPAVNNSLEWLVDAGSSVPGDWEVRATLTSGTTPTNNAGLNTWLDLSSTRRWGNTRAGVVGTTTSTLTLDFGAVGTSTSLVTVTGMVIAATII